MLLDMSTTLALAQTVNEVAAVPGAASSWYLAELEQNALAVDAATASTLYALGVLTSTAISEKREPDMASYVARWSAMGVVDGVCTHAWYECLQGGADALQLGRMEPVAMTLFSSSVYTPIYCAAFLLLLSLLEGKGWAGAQARVRADVEEMLWKTTKVWGPTNFLLFALVPLQTRTIVSMGIHYVFLVGLALWDAAIRERRATPAAPGPETASFPSISDEQLRLATAFVAVEGEADLSLAGDGAELPAPDV